MQITLYKNFKKRINSTKQPTGGTAAEVTLKRNTSVESPVFIIDGIDLEVNYLYALGHYYYIDDIVVLSNDLYELHCRQDVLATYKNDILATSAYVLRSASESDGEVVDNMYPIKADVDIVKTAISGLIPASTGTGTYVLGIVGTGTGTLKQGSVTYYGMSKTMLENMCNTLFTTNLWQNIKNDIENPLDCVASCYWLPLDLSSTNFSTIKFGKWELEGTEGFVLGQHVEQEFNLSVSIPKHPQAESRGIYLNQDPFSNYYITSTAFGNIPLPSSKLINSTSLSAVFSVDVVTGQAMLDIATSEVTIARAVTQMGVPVALSQSAISMGAALGVATSITGVIGSAVSGNVPGAIAGASSAVSSAIGVIQGEHRTQGANGSFIAMRDDIELVAQFNYVTDEDNTNQGRPLCEYRTLSTLSGYTLCGGASISIDGLGNDKADINSLINGGFYIE